MTINSDGVVEPDETFFLNLSNESSGTMVDGQAVVTITGPAAAASTTTTAATAASSSAATATCHLLLRRRLHRSGASCRA